MILQTAVNMWTMTETVGTLLSGAGAISVLVFMSKQINRESRVAGCEFILKVSEGYDSQPMKVKRARLANALISNDYLNASQPKTDDMYRELRKFASPVLGYFEDLGMMLRQKLVPTYFVWVTNGVNLIIYYEMMREYIQWVRREDSTYYKDFEYLYEKVKAFDLRYQAPKSPLSGIEHLLREIGSLLPWEIFSKSDSSPGGMAKREFLLRELDVKIRPFDPSDVAHTLVPPRLRDRLLKYHNEHNFLAVAELLSKGEPGHEYLGYLVGTVREADGKESFGEIFETFVDTRFRKKGIGERLCTYFCERLKQWDIKGCKVTISTTDEAVNFYTQIGFKKGNPIINKFVDGRDGYELSLTW